MFAALHHIGLIKRKLTKPKKVWIEKACRVAYRHADSLEETIFSQGEAEDGEEQEQVEDEVEEEEEEKTKMRTTGQKRKRPNKRTSVSGGGDKDGGARLGWKRVKYRFVWCGVLIVW
jgi:hypothetical protein